MDPKNKRKPVPAGGQPIPAAVEAANAIPPVTPPATDQSGAAADTPPVTPPAADTPPPAATDQSGDDELLEARVLVAFGDHQPDDIVTGTANEIEQLELDGKADSHPDAVAFARELAA